jgi:hypothetical protein
MKRFQRPAGWSDRDFIERPATKRAYRCGGASDLAHALDFQANIPVRA